MTGSILQVELIEDAVSPVGGKGAPIAFLEGAALGKEAHEVGLGGDSLGGDEAEGPRSETSGNGGWIRVMRGGKGCGDIVIDWEKRSLLRRAGKTVVDIIAADLIVAIADGDDVDTISWGKGDIPVILRHSGDDIIMR